MVRYLLSCVVVALGFEGALADEPMKLAGKDLKHINGITVSKESDNVVIGEALAVDKNGNPDGGHLGFAIPDKYKGKKVRIRVRMEIQKGQVSLGIDDFKLSLVEQSEFWGKGDEKGYEFTVKCPAKGDLRAVLVFKPQSKARIATMSIELAE